MKKVIAESQLDAKQTLYHYTKEDGFLSIISTGKLRFSNYLFLNKKNLANKEIDYALNVLNDIIKSIGTDQNQMFHQILHQLPVEIKRILQAQRLYVLSFCLSKDHPHAWQKYANNYQGFAIGFSPGLFSEDNGIPDLYKINFTKIRYGEEQCKFLLRRLVNICLQEYKKLSFRKIRNQDAIKKADIASAN